MIDFDLKPVERNALWNQVITRLEAHFSGLADLPVSSSLDKKAIRTYIQQLSFDHPLSSDQVITSVMDGLTRYLVHTPHPSYFGLFNPRPNFPSMLADVITAGYNPQMAAWSHAPYAAECESHVIHEIGIKFGWKQDQIDGTFCSGGAEANLTAVLCALQDAFPAFAKSGVLGLDKRPIIYTSEQSHHSIARAARITGLGSDSVRNVPVLNDLTMGIKVLNEMIIEDINNGHLPIMIAATAGATGPGAIDPLKEIAACCKSNNMWFHVDAAYGGALILSATKKYILEGIDLADTITFDIHKWTSVPMAASLLMTSHPNILSETFRIHAAYMPRDAEGQSIVDPFAHSMQWSRRFIGLKLYMTLACFGWKGMNDLVDHTCQIGNLFREKIEKHNWNILNYSKMPIIVFSDDRLSNDQIQGICDGINKSGQAWISTYPIHGVLGLRVCITNYKTSETELDKLVGHLNKGRSSVL